MAREFQSIPAFMSYLARLDSEVRVARERGAAKAGEMLVAAAKDMVGQEIEEWPDLAASTIEEKTRLGYTGMVSETDPNLRTGEFRASISAETKPGKVLLGSDDPIARYLEDGTERMPPRPTITLTMHQQAGEAADVWSSYVMGAVAGRSGPMRSLGHRPKTPIWRE